MDREKLARDYFGKGFACSQSVAAACADLHSLDADTMLALGAGFGGGLRCGETCGALCGAIMTIGLLNPFTDDTDAEAKAKISQKSFELVTKFREKLGSTRCAEIIGCDVSTPAKMMEAKAAGKTSGCADLIATTVALVEEMCGI